MAERDVDSAFFNERREHLRATKGLEPANGGRKEKEANREAAEEATADEGVADRRHHPRLSLTIPVRLQSSGADSLTVRTSDISWGGLRFIAPKTAVSNVESLNLLLPWKRGEQISAVAKVLRREDLDEDRALVAARFTELSTSDHHRLEKLLQLLRGRDEAVSQQRVPLVPMLEILFEGDAEIREKLAEISEGRISVTTFESYKAGQSIRFVLGGIADAPALRLRARVEKVDSTVSGDWVMHHLELRFEHPAAQLKEAAAALERYLPSDGSGPASQFDSYILLDPLD